MLTGIALHEEERFRECSAHNLGKSERLQGNVILELHRRSKRDHATNDRQEMIDLNGMKCVAADGIFLRNSMKISLGESLRDLEAAAGPC